MLIFHRLQLGVPGVPLLRLKLLEIKKAPFYLGRVRSHYSCRTQTVLVRASTTARRSAMRLDKASLGKHERDNGIFPPSLYSIEG